MLLRIYRLNVLLIALSIVALGVMSCDSADGPAIQRVDSSVRLTDQELEQKQGLKRTDTYYFGFDLRASPQEDVAQYLPFLNYLEKATGYHFKLHFTPRNSTAADELGQNRSQFSAMGASSFLYAQSRYAAKSLARGLNHQGRAEYQSVLVVKPASDITSIKMLEGKKLAFGSRDSTQGHLIPRIMLKENKIPLDKLQKYSYTGSHQNCAEAVVAAEYDVCGLQDELAKSLASRGQVKIIHTSRYYPSSGIVANRSVDDEVVKRVRQALLDFDPLGKHRQGLYNWDKTEMPRGFVSANKNDYAELREWSIRLGFLQESFTREGLK